MLIGITYYIITSKVKGFRFNSFLNIISYRNILFITINHLPWRISIPHIGGEILQL